MSFWFLPGPSRRIDAQSPAQMKKQATRTLKTAISIVTILSFVSCSVKYADVHNEFDPKFEPEMNYEMNKISIMTYGIGAGMGAATGTGTVTPVGSSSYGVSRSYGLSYGISATAWKIYKGRKEIKEYDLARLVYGKEEGEKVRKTYHKFKKNQTKLYISAFFTPLLIGAPFLLHYNSKSQKILPVRAGTQYYYYTPDQTMFMANKYNDKLRQELGLQQGEPIAQ